MHRARRTGRTKVLALTAGGIILCLTGGAALASAGESEEGSSEAASSPGFEIEIDPELDALFGPRPVNAVQAADIVTADMPGARVVKVELDEEDGRAVWGVEAVLGSGEAEADVDAFTGEIVGREDGGGDDGDDDGGGDD